MRKVLLLVALCMAAVLVFAPTAMAQDDLNCDDLSEAEEQAVFAADTSDPNNLDDDDDGRPCEDDTSDNGSFSLPEETTMMEETMMAEPTMMEETTMMAEPTVSGAAQYTSMAAPTPEPLPETGGPSAAAFALPSLALLVAGGIFAARLVRR